MDTTTRYLGLELRHPLVASAGPLTQSVDAIRTLADTGVGAVVLHSMFAERLRREAERDEELEDVGAESFAEASTYFPSLDEAVEPGAAYLSLLERAAGAVDVPLIASLNAAGVGSWTSYARRLADAGASAIEANVYFVPGDVTLSGADVEARQLEIVAAVVEAVSLPVAVKLSPFLSSPGNFALRVVEAGASGLVLFNRFLQPSVNVERLAVEPGVALSHASDAQVPRTWIATLRNHTSASLAATSGVTDATDVAAYLLAGADVVMTTSALVRNGAGYARTMIDGLSEWMSGHGFTSTDAVRGRLAVPCGTDENAFARSGYLAALEKAQSTYGSLRD
jgi:dihydroorotate dehydrogenase (fumarate)